MNCGRGVWMFRNSTLDLKVLKLSSLCRVSRNSLINELSQNGRFAMDWGSVLWLETNQTFTLRCEEVHIGRKSTCAICLPNSMSAASSVHCALCRGDTNGCSLIDSSANGTYLNPDSQIVQNDCKIKRGQRVPLSVGDVIGITVGFSPDGAVELTLFRVESLICGLTANMERESKTMEQDEETCADSAFEATGAAGSLVGGNSKTRVAVNFGKTGCKRLRTNDCDDTNQSTEGLDAACSKAKARAAQLEGETERLCRSAEQLVAKLDISRYLYPTNTYDCNFTIHSILISEVCLSAELAAAAKALDEEDSIKQSLRTDCPLLAHFDDTELLLKLTELVSAALSSFFASAHNLAKSSSGFNDQEGDKEERAAQLRREESKGTLLKGRRSELVRLEPQRQQATVAFQARCYWLLHAH
jgi:hypothetical protein